MNRDELISKADLENFRKELCEDFKRNLKEISFIGNKKKWGRTKDLKKLLGLSDSQIQTLRINGTLPFTTLGKTYYYDLEKIEDIMKINATNCGK